MKTNLFIIYKVVPYVSDHALIKNPTDLSLPLNVQNYLSTLNPRWPHILMINVSRPRFLKMNTNSVFMRF